MMHIICEALANLRLFPLFPPLIPVRKWAPTPEAYRAAKLKETVSLAAPPPPARLDFPFNFHYT